MLSPKTIKNLQDAQAKLDEFIKEKNNLADNNSQESFIRTKIALLVEIGELANELETFKHWKKNKKSLAEKKPTELAQSREELIDCLHFYLSWANSFGIDFSDYKFKELVPEPGENELLLALFSETEKFSLNVPWKVLKPKMLDNHKKIWEDAIKKLNSDDKEYEKSLKSFREVKEKTEKEIEKMNSSFLEEIKVEKNKQNFYHWLTIFEELAYKLGMRSEKDIEGEYMKKNDKNWKRQLKNY